MQILLIIHEAFHDCGYILTENDLIVDIDSMEKEVHRKNY